jgi:signal transduction histidine kinase
MSASAARRSGHTAARPGRLWMLALAVLLPGLTLAGLGLRGALQEQRAVENEERDRLERLADRGVLAVKGELRRWREVAAELAAAPDPAREETLRRLARPAAAPGDGPVLLARAAGEVHAFPRGSLIYAVDTASAAAPAQPIPRDLAAADDLALHANDIPGAIRAYERLLRSVPVEFKPAVLNRLGRNYAATGQIDAGIRAYAELETMADGRVGPLPASLVGAYERCRLLRGADGRTPVRSGSPAEADGCAVRVYEGLVTGRWPIEKPRFEDYIAKVRPWLAGDPRMATHVARLAALEARARVVTEEAGTALTAWQAAGGGSQGDRVYEEAGRVWMSFVASGPAAAARDSLLVLPSSFLSSAVWAQILPMQTADDAELVLVAPGGTVAYQTRAPADAAVAGVSTLAAASRGTEVSRTLRDGDTFWQVQARGHGPGRLAGTLVVRQRVYIATLLLMVASLVIGAVFVTRTVRRELEISRLKSQFVSAVSHEFRSPLTSIRQLAELLDRGVPSPERSRQYFKVILDESERLSRLVERVLDFSRMEEGRQEYTMAPIDTAPWLARVAADAAHALSGKRLETSLPADLPSIVGDAEALATAVHNLLDNAAKYSPGCDTVWLSADARAGVVAISVRDRGIGIAPEDRAHLFDRFYRGAATADVVKGTGLGLSLVKHIVDAHRGRVRIESTAGEGTTVALEIPIS